MKRALVMILCLIALTACSSRQIVKTEYVRQEIPSLPSPPAYYPVKFGPSGAYCLDEANAKALLKNIEIMRAYSSDMREILKKLKGETD